MTAKLSEPMKRLLMSTPTPDAVVMYGPTRAALMRRGLVHKFGVQGVRGGTLTPEGRQYRAHLIEAAAREAEGA